MTGVPAFYFKAELSGPPEADPLKAELNSEIHDFIYSYETYACGINETYAIWVYEH